MGSKAGQHSGFFFFQMNSSPYHKLLKVHRWGSSAGRRQQAAAWSPSIHPHQPSLAAATLSSSLMSGIVWGICENWCLLALKRSHGSSWHSRWGSCGRLRSEDSTWWALLLAPGHLQLGSISQRLSEMPCRKCCFLPDVAMVTKKQAPFQALLLAAMPEGGGECTGA